MQTAWALEKIKVLLRSLRHSENTSPAHLQASKKPQFTKRLFNYIIIQAGQMFTGKRKEARIWVFRVVTDGAPEAAEVEGWVQGSF